MLGERITRGRLSLRYTGLVKFVCKCCGRHMAAPCGEQVTKLDGVNRLPDIVGKLSAQHARTARRAVRARGLTTG